MEYTGVVHWTRKLKRISRKIVNYTSHIQFLQACMESNRIPYGFIVKWQPACLPTSQDNGKIDETLHEASMKLMEASLSHNLNGLQEYQHQEAKLWKTFQEKPLMHN